MFAMNIKKAVSGDLPRLVDFDQIARNGPGRIEDIKGAIVRGQCWVYRDNGAPCGYAILQPDFFGRPLIRLVYVAADHRRRGIGSSLIRHLETVCGQDRVFTAAPSANTDMLALLARLDYTQCGEISGIDDKDREIVFMKRLGG